MFEIIRNVDRSGRLILFWFALIMVFVSAQPLAAQGVNISGVVTDENGSPLPFANVIMLGTDYGSTTDNNGAYSLDIPVSVLQTQSGTLAVTFIGYRKSEATVSLSSGDIIQNFTLEMDSINLDAIVVTGTAGNTQKRAIGNSVVSVKTDELTSVAPIRDMTELLTARSPGLTLMANGGEAGASAKIRIRGAGSLNAGLEPMIFIDGVRIESNLQGSYDSEWGGSKATSPLDIINPQDIESVEIIKGPSAGTLYGAEAAAGVIQIITKRGRPGGIKGTLWTIQTNSGQQAWDIVDTPTNYWLCTEDQIGNPTYPGCDAFSASQPAADRLLSHNPIQDDPVTNRIADNSGITVSARGSSDIFNYYFSFENNNEEGVFYNNFAKRIGGRANLGFVPSQKANVDLSVGYVRTHNRMPWNNNSSNGILRNGFRGRAGAMNDPWKKGYRGFSPELANQYDNQMWNERITMGLKMNYNPTEWLSNRLTLGLDRDDRLNREYTHIDTTGKTPFGSTCADGCNYSQFPLTHRWSVDYSSTLNFDFGENISSATSFGGQLNRRQYHRTRAHGIGLVANNINLVSQAATTSAQETKSEQTSLGFYAQELVGWKEKVYFTAAVRVDDNSAFGQDFSLVVYPKASLSYVISDEDWFRFNFMDQLKLRAAWGQAGNAPAPFSADRTYGTSQTNYQDQTVNYLDFGAYGNPDLKAETGDEIEFGFETSLLAGRVGLDFTYYNQRTRDALISIPDPPSSGWSSSHLINIGEIQNKGLELLVDVSPINNRIIAWSSTIGLSTNKNELISFGRYDDGTPILDEQRFGAFASVQRHREGYPLGGFWAVDVERGSDGQPVLTDEKVTVLNECTWTPGEAGWSKADCQEEYMGPMLPTREISWTNSITLFRNVRIFANLDYKGGHYQWNAINSINSRYDRNTWELNNPNPTAEEELEILASRSLQTKKWIQPADFIKLRELSISYFVPSEWTTRVGARMISLTLSGRNLWYTTDYKYREVMYDPEVTFYDLRGFTQLDYASMPMMRHWDFSVRVEI